MPKQCSVSNARAWEIWAMLDAYGRDLDTMAGNPMPLRMEAINTECARCADPDGIRWRILEIEKHVLKYRRNRAKK